MLLMVWSSSMRRPAMVTVTARTSSSSATVVVGVKLSWVISTWFDPSTCGVPPGEQSAGRAAAPCRTTRPASSRITCHGPSIAPS